MVVTTKYQYFDLGTVKVKGHVCLLTESLMADKILSYNLLLIIFISHVLVPSKEAYQHLAKHVNLPKEILWEEMSLVCTIILLNIPKA